MVCESDVDSGSVGLGARRIARLLSTLVAIQEVTERSEGTVKIRCAARAAAPGPPRAGQAAGQRCAPGLSC